MTDSEAIEFGCMWRSRSRWMIDGATELEAVHDQLPPGLSAADNELGWKISLGQLRELVEQR